MELPDKDSQAFWSGTEENFDVKPLFVTAAGKSSKSSADKSLDKSAVLDTLAKREPAAPVGEPAKTISAATATAQAGQSAVALLEIKPPEAPAGIGQDARFEIMAGGLKDFYGAIITLGYDPRIVEFKTASEGGILKRDNQQTSFLFSNNVKAGTIDIYMTRIGDVGGVEGAGGLCTLVFQGKSGGTSEVAMKSVKLTNFNREQIRTDARGAKVVVK
jgi:hypothetical protein